jgi:hypothetical protein
MPPSAGHAAPPESSAVKTCELYSKRQYEFHKGLKMSDLETVVNGAVDEGIVKVTKLVTEKLGETKAAALAPVIAQYGPALAQMTAAEIWAWLDLAAKGDAFKAYGAIVAKLPAQELVDEWDQINAKWQTANAQNAAAVAWQHEAMTAVLRALVTIAASMVVL